MYALQDDHGVVSMTSFPAVAGVETDDDARHVYGVY